MSPLRFFDMRMVKYRYLGDYYQAFRKGWIDALAETSHMFAEFYSSPQNADVLCALRERHPAITRLSMSIATSMFYGWESVAQNGAA